MAVKRELVVRPAEASCALVGSIGSSRHSSPAVRRRLCSCSKASTSALFARLLALPWKRPFFPAPFPCSSSITLCVNRDMTVGQLRTISRNLITFINRGLFDIIHLIYGAELKIKFTLSTLFKV